MNNTQNATSNICPLFALGRITATRGAMDLVEDNTWELTSLLSAHAYGDWGVVCEEDKLANDLALAEGSRILSVYMVRDQKVYVITSHCRTETTILLPEEY